MTIRLADTLQTLQHALETLRRTSLLARQIITALQRGESLSENALSDHLNRLGNIDRDRERMQGQLVVWQRAGDDGVD